MTVKEMNFIFRALDCPFCAARWQVPDDENGPLKIPIHEEVMHPDNRRCLGSEHIRDISIWDKETLEKIQ